MSNYKFYLLLFALIGGGFFVGFQFGQISHVIGGRVRAALSSLAVACLCGALLASGILGVFAFAHEIERCEIVKHEDGSQFTVTLILGPWRWSREIPTEMVEARR